MGELTSDERAAMDRALKHLRDGDPQAALNELTAVAAQSPERDDLDQAARNATAERFGPEKPR
jgi:hypothetical protein